MSYNMSIKRGNSRQMGIIDNALDVVRQFTAEWLKEKLEPLGPDYWDKYVLPAMSEFQLRTIKNHGFSSLQELDLACIISIFVSNSMLLTERYKISSSLFTDAKSIKDFRNRHSHRNSTTDTQDQDRINHDLGTIKFFLKGLGASDNVIACLHEEDESSVSVKRVEVVTSYGHKINVSGGVPPVKKKEEAKPNLSIQEKVESMLVEKPKIDMPVKKEKQYPLTEVEGYKANIDFVRETIYKEKFPDKALLVERSRKDEFGIKGRGDWDYLILLKFLGSGEEALRKINGGWECPDSSPYIENDYLVWEFPYCEATPEIAAEQFYKVGYMPHRLDEWISEKPNTEWSPDSRLVQRNLKAVEHDANWYLGNYFPRSFCETFCIYDYVFSKCFDKIRNGKATLTICDIGIGSGGATYGLIWALRKRLFGDSSFKKIKVYGFDGNQNALNLFEELKSVIKTEWPIEYEFKVKQVQFEKDCILKEDAMPEKADFVITSKCLQELACNEGEATQLYRAYFMFSKKIVSEDGLISVAEISNPARNSAMNKALQSMSEYAQLLPHIDSGDKIGDESFLMCSSRINRRVNEQIFYAVFGRRELLQNFPILTGEDESEVNECKFDFK